MSLDSRPLKILILALVFPLNAASLSQCIHASRLKTLILAWVSAPLSQLIHVSPAIPKNFDSRCGFSIKRRFPVAAYLRLALEMLILAWNFSISMFAAFS